MVADGVTDPDAEAERLLRQERQRFEEELRGIDAGDPDAFREACARHQDRLTQIIREMIERRLGRAATRRRVDGDKVG